MPASSIDTAEPLHYRPSWNAVPYGLVAILIAFYGSAVCPFIESLTVTQLLLPLFVVFSLGLLSRRVLRKQILPGCSPHRVTWMAFQIDFATLLGVSMVLSCFNMLIFDFPLESGMKLMVGITALG
ncbi:MAG: hypothetical protein AAF420_15405, partial [Pseudomonadota bacterium]